MSSSPERRRTGKSSKATVLSAGQVRLIAGQWRGRKLPVIDAPGLRPTGDRVRETLFNWLQADIAGSCCLDLFAGTGALGLEALSRHAQSTVFVEPDVATRSSLLNTCDTLGLKPNQLAVGIPVMMSAGAGNVDDQRLKPAPVTVFAGTADHFLVQNNQRFDVVFIDPPFESRLQWAMLEQLVPIHLTNSALIYIESPVNWPIPEKLPIGCYVHKEKQFGDVYARLLRFSSV